MEDNPSAQLRRLLLDAQNRAMASEYQAQGRIGPQPGDGMTINGVQHIWDQVKSEWKPVAKNLLAVAAMTAFTMIPLFL